MATTITRVEVTGPVHPATAWQRYDNLTAWNVWAPQIRAVGADGQTLARGRTGIVRTAFGPDVPFVVTDVDPVAMTWSWLVRIGPVHLTFHHSVSSHARGTRAGLVVEGPAAVVNAYAPLARLALRRLVAA